MVILSLNALVVVVADDVPVHVLPYRLCTHPYKSNASFAITNPPSALLQFDSLQQARDAAIDVGAKCHEAEDDD